MATHPRSVLQAGLTGRRVENSARQIACISALERFAALDLFPSDLNPIIAIFEEDD